MSLNATPGADRVHIGIFGKRNAGKSSVINAITGQNLAIVSDIKGTTTDPVSKAMELLPLGPVVIIDTPGLDDEGALGTLRVQKSYQVLNKTDIAVVVVDGTVGITDRDKALIERIEAKHIPCVIVMNKADLVTENPNIDAAAAADDVHTNTMCHTIWVSTRTGLHIQELKELIAAQDYRQEPEIPIVADLLSSGDFVVLVVPIDSAAPKGRLILPQQQTIRDILDAHASAIVVQETELAKTLSQLGRQPKLVITDSQAFQQVSKDTPEELALTSFSILFARHKGSLEEAVKGAAAIDRLEEGDHILIAEGCTHHRQCDDIGTVKLPRWIQNYTKKEIHFDFTSGTEFPDDLSPYRMIVHCGGCTLNEREMKYRIQCAVDQKIPITNYGILIAHINGILARSVAPFPAISSLLV